MRIVWVTAIPVGALLERRGQKLSSGQWINAEYEREKNSGENDVFICTTDVHADEFTEGRITFTVLPHGYASKYEVNEANIHSWKEYLERVAPDVILIWGTEYEIGRCCLLANNSKIPTIIYIQGVAKAIAESFRAGLSDEEIEKMATLPEKIRKITIANQQARFFDRAKIEREMISLADGIVVENDWAGDIYRGLSENIKIYWHRLPFRKEFSQHLWRDDQQHTILTTSAGYPLKGLHVLLRAFCIVLRTFPDASLIVPGHNPFYVRGWKQRLFQSGYGRYIRKYIASNGLADKIHFVGTLSSEEYASYMESCGVFVSSSAIENHGSAIREAMCVGTPCICSAVGGIPAYAVDGENSLLFPFPDEQALASDIIKVFENNELRVHISEGAKKTIKTMYEEQPLNSLNEIYSAVMADTKRN